ncbi:MAG: ABC transporter permease [Paracoccus sp. (in: a-proteobacteria)]|nr:ABC transporter permease [Paracoccus sp. (in: a-proteobacteria)]
MTDQTAPNSPPRKLRPVNGTRRFAMLRTIWALMLREMSTTYGKTGGGYIWAILEPVAGIALLTMVFSVVSRQPMLGVNFQIFYATGLVPLLLFTQISSKVATSLQFSRALLFYPAVTYTDALIARILVNLLTQLLVGYIIFAGIMIFWETRTDPQIGPILMSYAMISALAVGVGVLNCFLFSFFPVWEKLWSILTRPLFIISCIFFTLEAVPRPWRDYLWYNPVAHAIGEMRNGFYHSYSADYVSYSYVFGISAVCTLLGLALLQRYHRYILNET